MKTFIIASDFSEESQNATEYAVNMAKEVNARLVLFHLHIVSIHAVNARLSYDEISRSIAFNRQETNSRVEQLAKKYNTTLTTHWAMGNFHKELSLAIAKHNAELVFIGMHKKSVELDLLGSTTTEAIHNLKIPIMAVPAQATFTGIKKILFTCDLEKGVHENILEKIKHLAANLGSEIELFHVGEAINKLSENNQLNVVNKEFEGISYVYKNVKSDLVLEEIKNEITRYQPDVLLMIPYTYGFWSSLIHKSKTRVMASGMNIPLLSIHA